MSRGVFAHGPVAQGQEQLVGLALAKEFGTHASDVVFQKRAGQLRPRHNALFGPLAAIDPQRAFLEVHVFDCAMAGVYVRFT